MTNQSDIKLSLIISQRNDAVGTLITIRSALEEFKSLGRKYEIIIADNSDNGVQRDAIQDLIPSLYIKEGIIKLIYQPFPSLFSARELAISKSFGTHLLFVDSHCLFGRDSISNLLNFSLTQPGIGFAYGICCYSHRVEEEGWCDRDVTTSKGIRLGWYHGQSWAQPFQAPFRGMPFICSRTTFDEIGGYGFLSRHRLAWGGGDYFLGLKSSLFGFTNWTVPSSLVIHLGPFSNDRYLIQSFLREPARNHPVRIGMLAAAYALGGTPLANHRLSGISKLVNQRTLSSAIRLGEEDRRWIQSRIKVTYNQLVEKFSPLQNYQVTSVRTEQIPPSKLWPKPVNPRPAPKHPLLINRGRNTWEDRIRDAEQLRNKILQRKRASR